MQQGLTLDSTVEGVHLQAGEASREGEESNDDYDDSYLTKLRVCEVRKAFEYLEIIRYMYLCFWHVLIQKRGL